MACPCGLGGDTCDILAERVISALNSSCAAHSDCEVNSNGTAFCLCRCGSTGEFCNNHRVGSVVNYVLGYVLVAGMLGLILFGLRRFKDEKLPYFGFSSAEFAKPRGNISSTTLFVFRLLVFVFAVAVQVVQFVASQAVTGKFYSVLQTYTVWNFVILIIYFGIGLYLSFLSLKGKLSEQQQPTYLQRIHAVFMEVRYNLF